MESPVNVERFQELFEYHLAQPTVSAERYLHRLRIQTYTPLLLDIILGRSDDYFLHIGGGMEMQDAILGGDHLLDLELRFRGSRQALLLVHIRLFSQIRSPAYHVVVGEIDLDIPQHTQVFERHRVDQKLQAQPAP
jgi:hypothetical protein